MELAGADPAGASAAPGLAGGTDQDILEVERLLSLAQRPLVGHRLAVLLSELNQVSASVGWMRKWSPHPLALPLGCQCCGIPHSETSCAALPGSHSIS